MFTNGGTLKSFKVNDTIVGSVPQFNITPKTTSPTAAILSNSLGGTQRVKGVKSWSGGLQSYQFIPAMIPGKEYEVSGYYGPREPDSLNGLIRSGTAICTSLSMSIVFGTGAPILWTYAFTGSGELVDSLGIQIDESIPEMVSAASATISAQLADGTTIDTSSWRMTQVDLSITGNVSGGVADSSSRGWVENLGSGFDFTANSVFNCDRSADLGLDVDDVYGFTVTFDNGKELSAGWILIQEEPDVTADNNSANPLTVTLNGGMKAHGGANYGGVSVDETVIWPTIVI